ncbi:MAG: helix-hairpin-helix domain-containing protein [Halobacteria archaeon]
MAAWSIPGLGEAAARRLEEAGFTPASLAAARPSELVKRAGLRADLARRIVTQARRAPPAAGNGGGSESEGSLVEELKEREWERVWDLGAREAPAGAPWRWKGKVVLKVSLLKRE